jgi:hypothetical protein
MRILTAVHKPGSGCPICPSGWVVPAAAVNDPSFLLPLVACRALPVKKGTPFLGCRGNPFFYSLLNDTVMAVYIVKEGKKLTIITVKPEQEACFQADYAGSILVAGDSIQDVLIRFGQLPQLQELNEEVNQGKSPE